MNKTKRILFLVAYPFLRRSRANRTVAEAVRGLEGLTYHDLYERYPYFHIDTSYEKSLLLEHDLLVVQHPFYWYSMPPLLKLWVDDVFQSGWAYGPGGDRLKGKDFWLSLSVGGQSEAYREGGMNRYPLEMFLTPWEQTVHLCQMRWHKPVVLYGSIRSTDLVLQDHALKIRARLERFTQTGKLE